MLSRVLHILLLLGTSCAMHASGLWVYVRDSASSRILDGCSVRVQAAKEKHWSAFISGPAGIEIGDVKFPLRIQAGYIGFEKKTITFRENDVQFIGGKRVLELRLEKAVMQMNELVVTGQTVPVMAKQSVYKVNTLSGTEIHQRAAVSLNDVLNYEMNQFVSNDNILGSSTNISGIGGQNVKILLNGIPVMGRENGNIDLGQLNLNNIKRVEMIQGPMSVIYGSNALGGVINLITTTPRKKYTASLNTYCESIGKYNINGSAGFHGREHEWQLSLARNFFAGWSPNDSVDRFQLWKPKTQYTGDLQYTWSHKRWKWNSYTSYLHEKITNKGVPVINPYEGYAFDEYYRTQRLIEAVTTQYKPNENDQFVFTNSYQLYYRIKNRFKKNLVTLTEFPTSSVGDQDTSRFTDINLRGTYSTTRIKKIDMLLGYEYAWEKGNSYKLADQIQSMQEGAVFGSATIKPGRLQMQPSLRYTYHSRYHSNLTPAVHARYEFGEHTQLRASYARGFRAPTLKELYLQFIDQNHTILGNPDLKPEKGDHVELGLDHQKNIGKWVTSYSLNAYYNAIHDLIALAVFNNHSVLRQYANLDHYRNRVLNLKASVQYEGLTCSAGAGEIFVEKTDVTPAHQITECTGSVSYRFRRWNTAFNFNYKYNSRQPVITVDQQFLYTSPLHIANASIQKSLFKKKVDVQLGIKNLFNIQDATLNGINPTQASGHTAAGSMQLFPKRSGFIDLTCRL